jgi:hypothetical protein
MTAQQRGKLPLTRIARNITFPLRSILSEDVATEQIASDGPVLVAVTQSRRKQSPDMLDNDGRISGGSPRRAESLSI